MSEVRVNESTSLQTIMLKNAQQIQRDVKKSELSEEKFYTITDMSEVERAQFFSLENKLVVYSNYQKDAQYLERKFSIALEVVEKISKNVNDMSYDLANINNLDATSRASMNAQIDNSLQFIQQQLSTPYGSGYLFGSNFDNTIIPNNTGSLQSNVHPSYISLGTFKINPNIDPNDLAITQMISALKDIKTQVNDPTVTIISPASKLAFSTAQNAITIFVSTLSHTHEKIENTINSNQGVLKDVERDFEEFTKVNPAVHASALAEKLKSAEQILSLVSAIQKFPSLISMTR